MGGLPIAYTFSILSMSLGYLFSILIKESSFSNRNEFYFYYNFGITKQKLYIVCGLIHVIFALVIIIGYYYAK